VRRVYCVGRNYAEHAREMGCTGREAPFFFLKPADNIVEVAADGATTIPYPGLTRDLQHEVELVVALGKGGSHVPADRAADLVYGYAVGLDLTRRDLQSELKKQGRPWCIAKGFEQSAPTGAVTPRGHAGNIETANIHLRVNGEERQRSNVSKLIWSIPEIIAHLSIAWELHPGDLIFTGTPEGVAALQKGDTLRAGVDGLQEIALAIG
jgi:fumarylpyruvate hydrolase